MATSDAGLERRDRSLPAGGKETADHARLHRSAGEVSQSGGDHNQKSAGYTRYRSASTARRTKRGGGEHFRHLAGPQIATSARTTDFVAPGAPGCDPAAERRA